MLLVLINLILLFTPYQALRRILGIMTVLSFIVYSIVSYILQKTDVSQRESVNTNNRCLKKVDSEIKINVDSICGKILWIIITVAMSLLYLGFTFYMS